MKTIYLIVISLIIISCKKDDDNISLPISYLPSSIEITETENPNENRIISYQYDNQNRIAEINYVFANNPSSNSTSVLNYNSNGLLTSVVDGDETINFSYNSQGVLNQISIIILDETTIINVSFNPDTNSYSISASGETAQVLMNGNNNIIGLQSTNYDFDITLDAASGVFANVQVPEALKIVSILMFNFDNLLFSSQQMNLLVSTVSDNSITFQFNNNRNAEGLIDTINIVENGATVFIYNLNYIGI
jgi:hypothetical protein